MEWKENDGTCSLVGSTMLWSMAVITASQIVQVTKLPGEDLLIFLGDEWLIRQCWIRGEISPGRQCFKEQVIPPSACWIARVGATSTVALRRTRRSCILVNVVSETKQKAFWPTINSSQVCVRSPFQNGLGGAIQSNKQGKTWARLNHYLRCVQGLILKCFRYLWRRVH